MTRKKKIALAVLVLGINALVLLTVVVGMCTYEIRLRTFGDLQEFVEANGSRNTLWQGTYYRGDHKGFSYFRHQMSLGRSCDVSVPEDSWNYTGRFEMTSLRKNWTPWSALESAGTGRKAEER
ncbi:MAG: hypothetical protein EOP85_21080 [Verrucomicrobiaceae bacterium]|nr:MAG: hypothetical protein EOP85_21080 [Verrucomicrobiaceae bacterium]